MNKKILFILLLFAGMANAQTVTIPDPVFRAYLLIADTNVNFALNASLQPMKVDVNGDGQIQTSEALAVYGLNLNNATIANLTGISSFTNLKILEINNNHLTSLNLNGLTNLSRLSCSGNQLTSLDVSGLTGLEFLFCDSNALSSLNVSGLTNLKFISCISNSLSTIDVNGLTGLQSVVCDGNQLTNLSLTNVPSLTVLSCGHNNLTSLNVTNVPTLAQLFCFYNQLTNLDLSASTNLTNLSCGENNIATLNLNGLTHLNTLECSYLPNNAVINGANLNALVNLNYTGTNSAITFNGFPNIAELSLALNQPTVTLNISGFNANSKIYMYNTPVTDLTINGPGTALKGLNVTHNQLTSLTLNGLGALESLDCSYNKLTNLNLTGLTGLQQLTCNLNKITNLNLSNLPNLKSLSCNNNKLTSLSVAALPSLEYLDFSNDASIDVVGNQINSLDTANLTNLKYLDFSNYQFNGQLGAAGNHLTSLDLSNLTQLEKLKCSKNNILTLTVNGLTHLNTLDCSYNSLTSLNLIGLTDLTYLNYSHNQLSSLNMTGLVNITELDCSSNSIATLTVTGLPNLTKLNCNNNLLATLNLSGLNLITELNCASNQISSLSINNLTNLTTLDCMANQISDLSVSNLTNLTTLNCGGNLISDLSVNNLTNLVNLGCEANQISNLDISALNGLRSLSCSQNHLTSLDLSNSPQLQVLKCNQNQLSSLNVTNLPNLAYFYCDHNQLTSLDLSTSSNLQGLSCDNNQLVSLDVSNMPYLYYLTCSNNLLAELFAKNGIAENTFEFYNNPALAYICADSSQLASIQTQLNTLGMTATVSNSYCTFTPGGPHNTVIGTTIFDGNNNGCNINDPLHPNIRVDFSDGTTTGSAFTNVNGICTFYAGAGNYTLFPNIENASAFNISPASASVNFPDNNNNISNQSFCLSANGTHPDLEVVISPLVPARPGFEAVYELVYKNKGNQSLSGSVTLTYDEARLDLVSALPAQDTQAPGSLAWSYSGMLPFESRTIRLSFAVNSPTGSPAVNQGDVLTFSTAITPTAGDETPADNAFVFNQIVVNSFDPNDITCLEGTNLPTAEIGNYLHYIVNFENTGTASAVNVVVRTEVDPGQYDLHSLQVMNTSHQARTSITGNTVEFIFENIQLASGDPVGGHGNVLFKIKSNTGLGQGDIVAKQADIYFDYNAPIVTNEAETVYQNLKNPDFESDDSVSVYPNPSNGIVNVKSASQVQSLELFDVQGRLLQQHLNSDKIDISSRSTGLYFLRIKTDKGVSVQKISRK